MEDLRHRAKALCGSAEPHGVGIGEPACQKHVNDAKRQLAIETEPAHNGLEVDAR